MNVELIKKEYKELATPEFIAETITLVDNLAYLVDGHLIYGPFQENTLSPDLIQALYDRLDITFLDAIDKSLTSNERNQFNNKLILKLDELVHDLWNLEDNDDLIPLIQELNN